MPSLTKASKEPTISDLERKVLAAALYWFDARHVMPESCYRLIRACEEYRKHFEAVAARKLRSK